MHGMCSDTYATVHYENYLLLKGPQLPLNTAPRPPLCTNLCLLSCHLTLAKYFAQNMETKGFLSI